MNKKNKYDHIIKIIIISTVLVFTSFGNLVIVHSSPLNGEAEAYFVLEQLSINADEVLVYVWGPVFEGEKIYSTKEHILNAPGTGYVVYIDLYPRANLFHPVKFVFLLESTQELIVKDAMSPPINFADYKLI